MLGEHKIHNNPDCPDGKGAAACSYNVTRTIDKVIIHEDYDASSVDSYNDIALIRLNEPVHLYDDEDLDPEMKKSGAKPVCLPWPSTDKKLLKKIDNLNNGENVVITGWGRTSNNRRLETVKLINRKVAQPILQYLQTKTANDLCKENTCIISKSISLM